ncbi:RagB/SusD family nutrient uptake outer membrane protein [Hymenobacter negativus]|uniref:RagB/SusD family nutrient uptake outer membrane protein n=1 Tax=Hymenobacter negativus TaxID=2795026 RepID=A0ABS3QLN0_9BACT|nr:RagB/SusD family nutrient uptake outer membrane protein [Hymenobacter negativus]MBO2012146.1 RagB/SusD family nutrient uptake outer membrane protein [Hymenobacter negativus]
MKSPFILRAALAASALAGTAGLLTACKDYLNVTPASSYISDDVFSSVANVNSAIIGVYDPLSGDAGYGVRLSTGYPSDTDEGQNRAGAADGGTRDINRYRVTPGTTELIAPFTTLYQGVERANICIKNIPQMALYKSGSASDQRALRRAYGEALTLRALYYMEIVRNWGDVPAQFKPSSEYPDLNLPQTPRNEIYDQILGDLALASKLLPWRKESDVNAYERFTKGAAKALRARIALARGGYRANARTGQMERPANYLTYYTMARAECDTLLQNRSQHTLNPSFEAVWRNINEQRFDTQYGEIMFEVAMGSGSAASDSKLGYNNGPALNVASKWGQAGGSYTINPNYFYAFDSVDTRRDVTVTLYQTVAATPNTQTSNTLTALRDGKFRRDWRVPILPGTAQNLNLNWPIVRFADVLLMFAEAQNELVGPAAAYNGTTPVQALEEVRRRAYPAARYQTLPATQVGTKAGFFDALVKERLLEFGGEGIRKYDLIRWNLLGAKIAEAKAIMTDMRNGVGIGATIPLYVYGYAVNDQLRYVRSLYRPFATTTNTIPIPGSTATAARFSWRQALTGSSTFIDLFAANYVPNSGDELLAFPQTVVDANPNLRQNFGY